MAIRGAPHNDPRRAGARILDCAEGVIVALCGGTLDEAFVSLVQTAKGHNVAPLSLADALVAVAQGHPGKDVDATAVRIVRETWGPLLDASRRGRPHGCADPERRRDPVRFTALADGASPSRHSHAY